MKPNIYVREASSQEDALIAEHFYQMWLDNEVTADSIEPDWLNITLQFIEEARQQLFYKAFVAEVDNRVIGSTSCQIFAGLYPHILKRGISEIWIYLGSLCRASLSRTGNCQETHQHGSRTSEIDRLYEGYLTRLTTRKTCLLQLGFFPN